MLEILYVFLLEILKDTADESNYQALSSEVAIKSILWQKNAAQKYMALR